MKNRFQDPEEIFNPIMIFTEGQNITPKPSIKKILGGVLVGGILGYFGGEMIEAPYHVFSYLGAFGGMVIGGTVELAIEIYKKLNRIESNMEYIVKRCNEVDREAMYTRVIKNNIRNRNPSEIEIRLN